MAGNTTVAVNNATYLDSLVSYVLDIKPYHTKLAATGAVVEQYLFSDDVNVNIVDVDNIETLLGADLLPETAVPNYTRARITQSWWRDVTSNGSTSTWPMPQIDIPIFSSEASLANFQCGLDDYTGIVGLPLGAYDPKRWDGPGITVVTKNGTQQQDNVHYTLSHGVFSANVSGGNWQEADLAGIAAFQVNSGALSYDNLSANTGPTDGSGGTLYNISGTTYEEWTVVTFYTDPLHVNPAQAHVTGSASGLLGTNAIFGTTFTTPQLTFTWGPAPGQTSETTQIGDTWTLTPSAKVTVLPTAPTETWSVIKSNPITLTSTWPINGALAGAGGYFQIEGSYVADFSTGTIFNVLGTNHGTYTVQSSAAVVLTDGSTVTQITITGTVPASGGGGYIYYNNGAPAFIPAIARSDTPAIEIHTFQTDAGYGSFNAKIAWSIVFNGNGTYQLNYNSGGTSPNGITYPITISLINGCSFKNADIAYTLIPTATGWNAGDAFEWWVGPTVRNFKVYGSVSGWQADAKLDEWYWNGKIGFKIPGLQYFTPDPPDDQATDGFQTFVSNLPVHSIAEPSLYLITYTTGNLTSFTYGTLYTPGTYTNVPLTGGSGTGAQATFVVGPLISNPTGAITSVTLTAQGQNYRPGDVLSATVPGGSGFSATVQTGLATVYNNIYGYRPGLIQGQVWADVYASFTIDAPNALSLHNVGDVIKVYLAPSATYAAEAGFDRAPTNYAISSAVAGPNGALSVVGDFTNALSAGINFSVNGAGANDGGYRVLTSSYTLPYTTVTVTGSVPVSAGSGGYVYVDTLDTTVPFIYNQEYYPLFTNNGAVIWHRAPGGGTGTTLSNATYTFAITGATSGANGNFVVSGNPFSFTEGLTFKVIGGSNAGTYIVRYSTFNGMNTTITVAEPVPASGAGGTIQIGDLLVIDRGYSSTLRLSIAGANANHPELGADVNDWVPLNIKLWDVVNPTPTSPGQYTPTSPADFSDLATYIQAFSAANPNQLIFSVLSPRFQKTDRAAYSTLTFDPTFFANYLPFGQDYTIRYEPDEDYGQHIRVKITENLQIFENAYLELAEGPNLSNPIVGNPPVRPLQDGYYVDMYVFNPSPPAPPYLALVQQGGPFPGGVPVTPPLPNLTYEFSPTSFGDGLEIKNTINHTHTDITLFSSDEYSVLTYDQNPYDDEPEAMGFQVYSIDQLSPNGIIEIAQSDYTGTFVTGFQFQLYSYVAGPGPNDGTYFVQSSSFNGTHTVITVTTTLVTSALPTPTPPNYLYAIIPYDSTLAGIDVQQNATFDFLQLMPPDPFNPPPAPPPTYAGYENYGLLIPTSTAVTPFTANEYNITMILGQIAGTGSLVGGTGYVDGVYYDVPLTPAESFGQHEGAAAIITVTGGIVTGCAITEPGQNYTVGEVLSASNANLGGSGSGFSITVTTVSGNGISNPPILTVESVANPGVFFNPTATQLTTSDPSADEPTTLPIDNAFTFTLSAFPTVTAPFRLWIS